MEFWQTVARVALRGNDIYAAYSFEGRNWEINEREIIDTAIKPHVPERVDSGFNTWTFNKSYDGVIYISRATWSWENTKTFRTVDEAAAFITEYYNR